MVAQGISIILVLALLHGSIAAQDLNQPSRQTVPKMQQVLRKAKDRDREVKVILNRKVESRKKFSGKVSEISESDFVITDQKTGASTQLAYADVKEIYRKGWSNGSMIGIAVLAGVVIAVLYIAYRLSPDD